MKIEHTGVVAQEPHALDVDRVHAIFMDCLCQKGKTVRKHIWAEGISMTVGFHPERLESHTTEIEVMLNELPDEFKKSGGESFWKACNDKHGAQWTGNHQRMEQLFLLGIGIGKVKCDMPREMWSILPGGMPYYTIL